MGGFGSGRIGGPPTISGTDAYALSITDLAPLAPGANRRLIARFTGRGGRSMIATIDLIVNVAGGAVVFRHETRRAPPVEISYEVRLATTMQRLGGVRWWFICRETGRRAHKLVLPQGGSEFWSRDGHRLGYRVKSLDKFGRRQRRCAKLLTKLGAPAAPWFAPVPDRPFGMRWETYGRLGRALMAAQDDANVLFANKPMVRRLLTRP